MSLEVQIERNTLISTQMHINQDLADLGYKGRLTAHGRKDVVVTSGQEVGKFDRDILLRQIGHTEHNQGASGCSDNHRIPT